MKPKIICQLCGKNGHIYMEINCYHGLDVAYLGNMHTQVNSGSRFKRAQHGSLCSGYVFYRGSKFVHYEYKLVASYNNV